MVRSLVQTVGNTAALRPSEGAGTTTLTVADKPHQIFNLTAARTCLLPSASIKAGSIWRIENSNAFDLTLQSSALANIVACRQGHIVAIALYDSPTLSSHWQVLDITSMHGQQVFNVNNISSSTVPIRLSIVRVNDVVTITNDLGASDPAKANTANPVINVPAIPSQYRSASLLVLPVIPIRNGGTWEAGLVYLPTTGILEFRRLGSAAWTASAGVTVDNFTFSYAIY